MVKIKTKKQLNLPQLIEWGFNNPELVEGKLYLTKEHDEYSPYVQFSIDGYGVRTSQSIANDDTFTVEVEEEVNGETILDKLVVRYNNDDIHIFTQERINDFKNDSSIVAFYIPNNDLTLYLIWTREKGLVE